LTLRPNLAAELGDRWLIKYVRHGDHARYSVLAGTPLFSGVHYVTPTPLAQAHVVSVLNLPSHLPAPRFALLLDPKKVEAWGPRRIRGGRGIEYILRAGFGAAAIVAPGWPIGIT
jgi:hypothetical protein